jgi:prepilin-type N-terminal cleavage/methylation domain-containing protein
MRALTRKSCVPRSRRGFTVIELTVSMVILTVGLLGMAANSAVIGRQMRGAQKMTQASATAQARFERLRSTSCTGLTGGNATVGEIVEIWTKTNGTRVVEVTDTVKFRTQYGQQVYAYRTMIPCPALP